MMIILNPQQKRDIVAMFCKGATVTTIANQNTLSRPVIENVLREAISGLSQLVSDRARKIVDTSSDSLSIVHTEEPDVRH